jgi:hypothetical protein
MTSHEPVSKFIASGFRSVWSLELLLLLKRIGHPCPREELVAALRASDLVIAQSLNSLTASGLVIVDDESRAAYSPASPALRHLVEEAEMLYSRSPDAVRRLIVGASPGGSIAAFADAFRLRKD